MNIKSTWEFLFIYYKAGILIHFMKSKDNSFFNLFFIAKIKYKSQKTNKIYKIIT